MLPFRAVPLLAASLWLLVPPGEAFAAPSGFRAPAPDTIAFVPLSPNAMMIDCPAGAPPARVCRVRRQRTAAELRARLAAGTRVWREADALSFVYRGEAASVELSGGIQGPMSRIGGTDLWTITVHAPELDSAIVSYVFIPMGPTIPAVRKVKGELWRGPRATPAPDTARALQGRLVDDTIRSRFLPAPRGVTAYVPPARGAEPIAGVVYVGDGQSVRGLAAEIDTLVAAGRLPRLLLVGVHCDTARGDGSPEQDGRMLEYLSGIDDSTRFLAHERFFLEEVLPWAERGYGAPTRPERRAVFGFSNSAAFAIDMGLRHPDLFGRVLAFSPAGKKPVLPTPMATPTAAFFLLGGLYEQPFHEKALRWGELFRAHDVRNTVREVVAGHDWEQWRTSLPEALAWAFGGAAATLGAR